jgi:hypothetical protein
MCVASFVAIGGSRPWPLAALQGLGIGDLFATDGRRDDALESLVCGP